MKGIQNPVIRHNTQKKRAAPCSPPCRHGNPARERRLFLLLVIDLVELALFVLALLQQVAVAVDVDVEIAVEFDDALVLPRLLLDG